MNGFKGLLLASALIATAGLGACGKKEAAPAPAAPASAPATGAAEGASTPAPTTTAGLPAECESYIQKVEACVTKLGAKNAAVGTIKQSLDTTRQQWASIPDKTALAASCKQADDMWKQQGVAMGC